MRLPLALLACLLRCQWHLIGAATDAQGTVTSCTDGTVTATSYAGYVEADSTNDVVVAKVYIQNIADQ